MGMEEFYGSDKLFTLKDASDPARVRDALWEALRHRFGPAARLRDVQVEVLRRRKQRCVLRYVLEWEDDNGRVQELRTIGKVYKADHGEPVRDLMEMLWRQGFARSAPDRIAIPEVTAYLPRMSLLLQEEIGGLPVKEYLGTPEAERAIRQMARGLAKLHRCPVRVGEPYTMTDHLRRCHPRPEVLRDRCPELRGAVEEVLAEAHRLESSYRGSEHTLIHGDFHMGQVHVSPTDIWLIDFDACAVADPAADLGNMLVFLKGKRRKFRDAPRLADAFLDEYFAVMPQDITKRIPLFEAVTHLRRACKRLRFQKDGWQRKARRFLDESLESLAAARG